LASNANTTDLLITDYRRRLYTGYIWMFQSGKVTER